MKTIARTLTFAAAVVFASIGQTGHAQSRVQFLLANVPFAFQSGSTEMGAGTYTIDMQNSKVLLLRGHGRSMMTMVHLEESRAASRKSCLVFVKIGDSYLLDQVWASGDGSYLQLQQSKKRIRKLKELAANNVEPTRVELPLESASTVSGGN